MPKNDHVKYLIYLVCKKYNVPYTLNFGELQNSLEGKADNCILVKMSEL
ncbi:hypothetical protein SAMN05444416_107113 [Thermoactinomyces sp. DSM 45892]|nr:hypothetical protein SAMN05444416_107113 [Thermoactinomyces sp. DSM 45892]